MNPTERGAIPFLILSILAKLDDLHKTAIILFVAGLILLYSHVLIGEDGGNQ